MRKSLIFVLMLLGAALVQVIVTILETRGDFSVGSFTDVFVILAVAVTDRVKKAVRKS